MQSEVLPKEGESSVVKRKNFGIANARIDWLQNAA